MGYVSKEDYRKQIDQIIMLLEGKTDSIIKSAQEEMEEYSSKFEFEKAAAVRDRIQAIERITEKQKVANFSENNIDVIGLYKNQVTVCVEIFYVRGSKMLGRDHYFFDELKDMDEEEIVSGFIKQFYINSLDIPNKIMLRYNLEEKESIEKWLSQKKRKKSGT
jgi:excinuclease ABC subunit C